MSDLGWGSLSRLTCTTSQASQASWILSWHWRELTKWGNELCSLQRGFADLYFSCVAWAGVQGRGTSKKEQVGFMLRENTISKTTSSSNHRIDHPFWLYICNLVKTQGFDHEIKHLLSASCGSVVRLSYEYNMTQKSLTYCDRTWCVVIFFANPTRKSNSKNQLKILARQ